jgi:DNA/RNA-binding domain of Phe-tRNA-synthetase-like protein
MQVSISDIADAFPDYRVAVVVAEELTIAPERPAALDCADRAARGRGPREWSGTELSQIRGVAAWRAAYKGFGIKQTRYRSSVERLVKNVLAGRPLARVNAFVDLYNAVSLAHVLPLGADDLAKVTPPLAFRYAREGDSFVDMAEGGEEPEAPKQARWSTPTPPTCSAAAGTAAGCPHAHYARDRAGGRDRAGQRCRRCRRRCRRSR